MYATVVDVDGDDVVLEVAPGVEVRYMKRAIMDVVSPGDEPEDDGDDSLTPRTSEDERARRRRPDDANADGRVGAFETASTTTPTTGSTAPSSD